MDRYNYSEDVRDKYEELTRVDDNLDYYNIEELKTIRHEIDAKIIELKNEENVNEQFNNTFIGMEIRENDVDNKRKRIHESRKARAKSMSKEELIEEA